MSLSNAVVSSSVSGSPSVVSMVRSAFSSSPATLPSASSSITCHASCSSVSCATPSRLNSLSTASRTLGVMAPTPSDSSRLAWYLTSALVGFAPDSCSRSSSWLSGASARPVSSTASTASWTVSSWLARAVCCDCRARSIVARDRRSAR
eukprot:7125059-Prymnesium_polylepis.1